MKSHEDNNTVDNERSLSITWRLSEFDEIREIYEAIIEKYNMPIENVIKALIIFGAERWNK